jgi:hypothetical protein
LIFDADGRERYRIEGYLPKDWFRARLEMGRARVLFMRKRFADAQEIYVDVINRYGELAIVAEATYWRDVCKYKATNDHNVLGGAAKELADRFPSDEWRLKTLPWAHD